ncbi:MAG: Cytidylate kinaselike family [Gemmatimonadetes bacterium]|jgi:cytidylate kinase|nr:Cytidylate kinaselike family [Gemmatimonadota bacterium]
MPVITISRQYGSGGSEVARRVAAELGWKVYDNELVEQVAARLGVTTAEVSAREERVSSLAERMASAMALGVPELMPAMPDFMSQPSEEQMVEVTQRVITEAVRAGPAVVVGRGAQCLLAARTDALHVYCYAPFEALVRYAIEHLEATPADAPRLVRDTNQHRSDYVKRHFKRDWRDFTNYDICLNTGRLGLDGAAALVVAAARRQFG